MTRNIIWSVEEIELFKGHSKVVYDKTPSEYKQYMKMSKLYAYDVPVELEEKKYDWLVYEAKNQFIPKSYVIEVYERP